MYLTYPNKKIILRIILQFKVSANMKVADYTAYALALTPKWIAISSDGQGHFDLL